MMSMTQTTDQMSMPDLPVAPTAVARELTADFTFRHLQLELMRLDMLLHRQIRRQQRRRQAGQDGEHGRGEQPNLFQNFYVSDEQAYALLQRPFGQGSEDSAQERAAYAQALDNIDAQIEALVQEAEAHDEPMRLVRLADLFRLNRFDLDTLL
ncbi:MAG: hypothetical protein KDD89_12715, partial [Anaerolineales bacterium]|nr:hypothetical protein [Anaerolineales bacterium]